MTKLKSVTLNWEEGISEELTRESFKRMLRTIVLTASIEGKSIDRIFHDTFESGEPL